MSKNLLNNPLKKTSPAPVAEDDVLDEAADNEEALRRQFAKDVSDEVVRKMKKVRQKATVRDVYPIVRDVVILALAGIAVFFGAKLYTDSKREKVEVEPVESYDVTLENDGFLGFTAVDFEDAVLGESHRRAKVIVNEREVSVHTTITKTGLFNWNVFSKTQEVIFSGQAQYTVDLYGVRRSDIKVDDKTRTVTVTIPFAQLNQVTVDPEQTVFMDTVKGFLAFGKLTLTAEEVIKVEKEAKLLLRRLAAEPDAMKDANRLAYVTLWAIFRDTVKSICPDYSLELVFPDGTGLEDYLNKGETLN